MHYKLSCISEKLYRYQIAFNQLTPEEQELWSSFDIGDITFFLSGQRERTPEYTKFMRVSRAQPANVAPQPFVVPPAPPAPLPQPVHHFPAFLCWKLPPSFILRPNPPVQNLTPPGPAPGPAPVQNRTPPGPAPPPGPTRTLSNHATRYLTRTPTGKRKKKIIWTPPR